MQSAQFVTVNDGDLEAQEKLVKLIDNQRQGKSLELDGDGVAYAGYVMESHGHPARQTRKLDPVAEADEIKARIAASSQMIRLRLKPGVTHPVGPGDVGEINPSPALREIIGSEIVLKRFLDRRLENNGVTMEGVSGNGPQRYRASLCRTGVVEGARHQPRGL